MFRFTYIWLMFQPVAWHWFVESQYSSTAHDVVHVEADWQVKGPPKTTSLQVVWSAMVVQSELSAHIAETFLYEYNILIVKITILAQVSCITKLSRGAKAFARCFYLASFRTTINSFLTHSYSSGTVRIGITKSWK